MGNYSFSALFTKEPAVIAGALKSVLWVGVLIGLVSFDDKTLAGIGLVLELILGLFVRSQSTSSSQPTLAVGTTVNAGSAVVASVNPPPEPTATVAGGTP